MYAEPWTPLLIESREGACTSPDGGVMDCTRIPIEERQDVPPCQYCGGWARWLNAGIVDLGPWHWHCAHCSPTGEAETASLEEDTL